MNSNIIKPSDGSYEKTVRAVFSQGGIIACPTETFYGLIADPFNEEAVEKIFTLKGRPEELAMSLIIGDISMVSDLTDEINETQQALMDEFWPGPLTIIFKAGENLPKKLTAGTGTIALRLTSNKVAKELSLMVNSPITATSANPTGLKPAQNAEEVDNYFDGLVDLIIDYKGEHSELGSTIIDPLGAEPFILRQGVISKERIFEVLK